MHLLTSHEVEYLAAARAGNSEAFTTLVSSYRKPLLVHCYRLSGSLDDAEDLVQETFLRGWHKIDSYLGKGSFRNWLYVIATRLWLDEVRRSKKQVLLPLAGSPADPDSPPHLPITSAFWLDPLPEAWLATTVDSAEAFVERRETISLAFMVAIQKLVPRQRVVLILRSVFNWRAEEVAATLEITVPAVNNLLYRARKNLAATHQEEMPATQQNLDQLVLAWESGDVKALVSLLSKKATFAMPPLGVWYEGRGPIERALQNFVFQPQVAWKLQTMIINGDPGLAIYQRIGQAPLYEAFGLIRPVTDPQSGHFTEITAFLSPPLVLRLGMPQTLAI